MSNLPSPNEIILLSLCFGLSGLFSGSEAILLSIDPDRAGKFIDEGGPKAKAMEVLVNRPNELLTTILVGNNLTNIFAASLMTTISTRLFDSQALGVSVGVTTLLTLIFGEIIPKTFARTNAEKLAVPIIRFLNLCYLLFFPIVAAMTWLITKVLGDNANIKGRIIRKDDIEYLVSKAEKEQSIDSKQIELLNSILEFPTIKVKDIMIPRSRVKYLKASMSFNDVIDIIKADNHSRYPVCEEDLEHTIGFLHVKSLAFIRGDQKKKFDIKSMIKDPFFVYEHMKIQSVFDYMNKKKVHLALVKDENGLVVGIVTLEDIIEEILGDIVDEHDKEDAFDPKAEGNSLSNSEGIIVDGHISLRDLYTEYDIKVPLNDHYSTLAGFILEMLGNNFPENGQFIAWEGLSFELNKVDEYEIRKIRIRRLDQDRPIFNKGEVELRPDNEKKKLSNEVQ